MPITDQHRLNERREAEELEAQRRREDDRAAERVAFDAQCDVDQRQRYTIARACSCGHVSDWDSLRLIGYSASGVPGVELELRDCPGCGSTRSIHVTDDDSATRLRDDQVDDLERDHLCVVAGCGRYVLPDTAWCVRHHPHKYAVAELVEALLDDLDAVACPVCDRSGCNGSWCQHCQKISDAFEDERSTIKAALDEARVGKRGRDSARLLDAAIRDSELAEIAGRVRELIERCT